MKCQCCDKILSTQEATRRFKESNTFVDMCNKCLATIDDTIETVDSKTLNENDYDDDY